MMILILIQTNQPRSWTLPISWDNLNLTTAWSTKSPLRSLSLRTFRVSKPNSNFFRRLSSLCPTRLPRSRVRLRRHGMKNLQRRSKAWMRHLIRSSDPAPPLWMASRLDSLHLLSQVQPIATLSLGDNHSQRGNTREINQFSQMNMRPLLNSHQPLVIHSPRQRNSRRKQISSSQTIKA